MREDQPACLRAGGLAAPAVPASSAVATRGTKPGHQRAMQASSSSALHGLASASLMPLAMIRPSPVFALLQATTGT